MELPDLSGSDRQSVWVSNGPVHSPLPYRRKAWQLRHKWGVSIPLYSHACTLRRPGPDRENH